MSATLISTTIPALGRSFTRNNRSDSAQAKSVTLTRRGRFLLFGVPVLMLATLLIVTLTALLFGSLANPANAASSDSGVSVGSYTSSVTVLQGQSLWSIAASSDPQRDVRDVVADIVSLNDLQSSVVQAGQKLFVPLPR